MERPNLIWHLRIQASWTYVLEREASHALHFDAVSQERMLQAGILSTGADRTMMTRSHGPPFQARLFRPVWVNRRRLGDSELCESCRPRR